MAEQKYGWDKVFYTHNKTRTFRNEVYANVYQLMTGDSFEVGEAYSLHLTKEESEEFKPWGRCWATWKTAFPVFVSNVTLEKIVKGKDKHIFNCWEN